MEHCHILGHYWIAIHSLCQINDKYSQPLQSSPLALLIISQKRDISKQHQPNGSDIIQDALKVDDVDGDGGNAAGLPCVTEQALRS